MIDAGIKAKAIEKPKAAFIALYYAVIFFVF